MQDVRGHAEGSSETVSTFANKIAPPIFYFGGKPFELNAAGIYVPASCAGPQFFDGIIHTPVLKGELPRDVAEAFWPNLCKPMFQIMLDPNEKNPFDFDLLSPIAQEYLKKHTDNVAAAVANSIFNASAPMWNPLTPQSIKSLFDKPIFEPPAPKPMTLFGLPVKFIDTPPIYGPSPLAGYSIVSPRHRQFTIEHDDSHLFAKSNTRHFGDLANEQKILKAIHAAEGEGAAEYAWSPVLEAHVRIV